MVVTILQNKQLIDTNFFRYRAVRKNDCSPNSGNTCRAHQGDKDNFEQHKFVGLQPLSSDKYVYASFRNMDDEPFNPIAKGFDLSKFGDVSVFGVSILVGQHAICLFPLGVSIEDAKKQIFVE